VQSAGQIDKAYSTTAYATGLELACRMYNGKQTLRSISRFQFLHQLKAAFLLPVSKKVDLSHLPPRFSWWNPTWDSERKKFHRKAKDGVVVVNGRHFFVTYRDKAYNGPVTIILGTIFMFGENAVCFLTLTLKSRRPNKLEGIE
jgi:hypothetical protein